MNTKPYCDYTFGQFECGNPVERWGLYCDTHKTIRRNLQRKNKKQAKRLIKPPVRVDILEI